MTKTVTPVVRIDRESGLRYWCFPGFRIISIAIESYADVGDRLAWRLIVKLCRVGTSKVAEYVQNGFYSANQAKTRMTEIWFGSFGDAPQEDKDD